MSAGFRTRVATLIVLHVEGAAALVKTQLRGPPGPHLPASVSALMRVLRDGGTLAQGAVAAAVAHVFDADLHEGIYVKEFLTVEDGGPLQNFLTAVSLWAEI